MANPTQLEVSIASLMNVFDKYASYEGKKDTLTKNEVKTLLEKELPGLLKAAKNPGDVDKLMKNLDCNGDSEVDFQEFAVLVVCVACTAHNRICKNQ